MKLRVAILTLLALPGCNGKGPVAKTWASIPDSGALAMCRDSLAGRRDGRCTVELRGGRFVLLRDSTANSDGFLRYWDYAAAEQLEAYTARLNDLEARLGPGRRCRGHLVVWPDHNNVVLLDAPIPEHLPGDSSGAWPVVIGAGPTETPVGGFEELCSKRGAA